MSIPGLGQLPIKASSAPVRKTINLQPYWEWRFQIPHTTTVTIRLASGLAERDGHELASNRSYTFRGTNSKILTWQGCSLEYEVISGEDFVQHVAELGPDGESNPNWSHLNLHFLADGLRNEAAAKRGTTGPRIMIVGGEGTGKTTLARTLTSYAVRVGSQPLVVNADPRQGLLALPGTLTGAVFATMLDIEGEGTNGWGGTPTSGPSAVPVKLPIVFQYGRQHATDDLALYKELVSKLAGAVTGRMSADREAKSSGLIIDTPGVTLEDGKGGMEVLEHIVEEFSVNMICVLGSEKITAALEKRFNGEKTSLGDPIGVCGPLAMSSGVVRGNETWLQACQHAAIKEYFFGDSKRTLSPFTQQVDFDAVSIYRMPELNERSAEQRGLEKIDPTPAISHSTLAVMNATVGDSPESVRTATVLGFVYVSEVNKDRRKLGILAPVSARIGNRPLLWGTWPEQFINLLG